MFNQFFEDHADFIKQPDTVAKLEENKEWAQDMIENLSARVKGKRELRKFIQEKHVA